MDFIYIRCAKYHPRFLKGESTIPYGRHVLVPVSQFIQAMDNTITHYKQSTNPVPVSVMPWSLCTFEFYVVGKDGLISVHPFKYKGIYDIDCFSSPPPPYEVAASEESILKIVEKYGAPEMSLYVWYTGKKGYRMAYRPGGGDEVMDCQLFVKPWGDPEWDHQGGVFPKCTEFMDWTPQQHGKGVKLDLIPHPETKLWPSMGIPKTQKQIASVWKQIVYWCVGEILPWVNMLRENIADGVSQFPLPFHPTSVKKIPPVLKPSHTLTGSVVKLSSGDSVYVNDIAAKEALLEKVLGQHEVWIDHEHIAFSGLMSQKITYFEDTGTLVVYPNRRFCPIHQKDHKHTVKHYYVYTSKRKVFVYVKCHSSAPDHAVGTRRVYLSGKNEEPASPVALLDWMVPIAHSVFVEDRDFIGDMLTHEEDEYAEMDLVFLKSGMGTGKTVAVSSLTKQAVAEDPDTRILVISTRQCAAAMYECQFEVKNYLDCSGNGEDAVHSYSRVVCSMESLHKICNPRGYIVKFDFIIIDECESVFSQFNSTTMEGKRLNYLLLEKLCKQEGTRVFCLDALLGPRTLSFFSVEEGAEPFRHKWGLIFNRKNRDPSRYFLHGLEGFDLVVRMVLEDLKQGKKIGIVSDSLTFIESFQIHMMEKEGGEEAFLAKKKILVITGSSDRDTKKTAGDCSTWKDYDVVMFSSAITVGNSFAPPTLEHNATTVYGFFNGVVTPRDGLQMMGRFRMTVSGAKHIVIMTNHRPGKGEGVVATQGLPEIRGLLKHRVEKIRLELLKIAQANPLVIERYSEQKKGPLEIQYANKNLSSIFAYNLKESLGGSSEDILDEWEVILKDALLQYTRVNYKLEDLVPILQAAKKSHGFIMSIQRRKRPRAVEEEEAQKKTNPYLHQFMKKSLGNVASRALHRTGCKLSEVDKTVVELSEFIQDHAAEQVNLPAAFLVRKARERGISVAQLETCNLLDSQNNFHVRVHTLMECLQPLVDTVGREGYSVFTTKDGLFKDRLIELNQFYLAHVHLVEDVIAAIHTPQMQLEWAMFGISGKSAPAYDPLHRKVLLNSKRVHPQLIVISRLLDLFTVYMCCVGIIFNKVSIQHGIMAYMDLQYVYGQEGFKKTGAVTKERAMRELFPNELPRKKQLRNVYVIYREEVEENLRHLTQYAYEGGVGAENYKYADFIQQTSMV